MPHFSIGFICQKVNSVGELSNEFSNDFDHFVKLALKGLIEAAVHNCCLE